MFKKIFLTLLVLGLIVGAVYVLIKKDIITIPEELSNLLNAETSVTKPNDSEVDPNTPSTHTHNYGEWGTSKRASCTDAGEEERVCDCGEKQVREIAATGHSFGEWSSVSQSSCTVEGKEERSCNCGLTESRTVAASEHTEGSWVVDKAATCTEKGSRHKECTMCKATLKTEEIAITGHKAGSWVTTKEATCTAAGQKSQKCTVCNTVIQTETISAKGHTWGNWTLGQNATCGTDGYNIRECIVCKTEEKDSIPATGDHNYINGQCSCGKEMEGTKGLEYKLSDDGTYYICTGYGGYSSPSKIVIPSYYKGKPVKEIYGFSWVIFDTDGKITEVIISEGIEEIRGMFIYEAFNLTSITIPSSVRRIDEKAFSDCTNLERVYFSTSGWRFVGSYTKDYDVDFSDPVTAANILRQGNYSGRYER